jgi:hypothetical protein
MSYKKLERYIPKMYQAAMKHLVYISDTEVRRKQEEKLIGTIASGLQTAIQNVLTAYGIGWPLDPRRCDCNLEELENMRAALAEQEREIGNAMIERQKAKKNAFKNGDIDQNSSFYKDHIKKYEYSIDLIFIKYRTNDHFTVKDVSIWTPFGSMDHSSFRNHISGQRKVSCDVSLGLDAGAVKGEGRFGYSYVRDRNGNIHPDDLDVRAGLSASVGKGPISASAGVSASLQRGTNLHGKIELTGNEYLDGFKQQYLGKTGEWIRTEAPSLELWNGEYKLTDRN